ncbi:IS30 family transposase [Spirosoma spitsbergense]|uniref:IS30 family transposase n=1 Tax=Spirosoma spitsbergense TaxID=431554 RepID=UPI0012FCA701
MLLSKPCAGAVFRSRPHGRPRITFDNGLEFARHESIGGALGAATYFAHPYHSWERGLNENTNGLIRQYIPKACPISLVRPTDVSARAFRFTPLCDSKIVV